MTVEVQVPETQLPESVTVKADNESNPAVLLKSSSYREESNFLSDLKHHEKDALNELKLKLEEAIIGNTLFKKQGTEEEEEEEEGKVDKEISLWGIPLLPSKIHESTDVILLKFLRSKEFKSNDAFEMLKKTLQWRKEFKADSLLNEELTFDLPVSAYINGTDREGHPICFNSFIGSLENEELYQKSFGTEENREKFIRWRVQLMEKGIKKLHFKADGINSLIEINDMKNLLSPSRKELRIVTKQAVNLLQENYPEFVARNIFINVPFWYYASNTLLSTFLTQRTKSKFIFARPGKETEILLKYISIEEIPIEYGGFKRDNDFEFSIEDDVSELILKSGSIETIEIPTPEAGSTFIWDLTVLGGEVNYKEEFVPSDEGSYSVLVQKEKKVNMNEGSIRNTFKNNEAGKIVLTIENASSKKKKVLYRYKLKKSVC
ncbi:patellin-4-like [Impatiens glandulifera]|uniref:patellin-4-like n=1 Tax=Impatiens glandulifera TaxID=253017 RepID=UPI001FB18974|nr:patellin-4-like [Impatiens glandulifera]